MNKIKELNKMEVTKWSIGCGEVEYVLVSDSGTNRNILINLGATDEEIKNMSDGEDIDITEFAFNKIGAKAWQKDCGFLAEYPCPIR